MSSSTITNEEIQKIALDNGFTTRRQPDGSIDLNPYVYDFARALLRQGESKEPSVAPAVDPNKPTIAVDFDGVLHKYDSEWQGADVVADGPVDEAMRFLTDLTDVANVAVFSTRAETSEGVQAMKAWLRKHLAEYWAELPEVVDRVMNKLSFPTGKPKAVVYLDDRAWQFVGQFPDPNELIDFTPWNKT